MRVYITGIAGFLGSHLADHLLAGGHEVIGCDNLSSGVVANIPDVEWWKGDITNGLWMAQHMKGCDVVFHCAAAAYEGVSVFSPSFISENIYCGSANVFTSAIKSGVRRIVNCSSMARYGDLGPPFEESLRPSPVDPYGVAKLAAERLLAVMSAAHGIEYATAVPHNIYGPRQNYWTPYRNVAAIMANRMLRGKQPIIYGDGMQERSFSYIDDVVPALAKMANHDSQNYRIINIGPGHKDRITVLKLAKTIADIVGIEFNPIMLRPRPCEVKLATCTDSLMKTVLGFEAKTPIHVGLVQLINWIKSRGAKDFVYGLELELPGAPSTWTEHLL